MPGMARSGLALKLSRNAKQDWLKSILLLQFMATGILFWLPCATVQAIPPNTPITNTATADYQVAGQGFVVEDSEVVVTSAGAGNSAPSALGPDDLSVTENTPGAMAGTLLVTDSDPLDTHTYSVDDPRFEVVGAMLRLVPGVSLDYETQTSIDVQVTVQDSAGASFTRTITVAVVDVNESPELSVSSTTAQANLPGAAVGTLTVVDPDAGDTHSYTVSDPRFEVVGGVLKLVDDERLALGEVATVSITVTDSGGLTDTLTVDVTGVPPGSGAGTNSQISALRYAPGVTGGMTSLVRPGQCLVGGASQNLNNPRSAFGAELSTPANANLLPSDIFTSNETLLVEVVDPDGNTDTTSLDTVTVQVTTAAADAETIVLSETGVNTGQFVGYVPVSNNAVMVADCELQVGPHEVVTLTYTDALDPLDEAVAQAVFDPVSRVFDSANGRLINGAQVELIDAATGARADVFAADGVTPAEAVVVSGTQGSDGGYWFEFVPAGNYQLRVTPPNRFSFPTLTSDVQLQALPTAPFALGPGARGQTFQIPVGPAFNVDIPLDLQPIVPTSAALGLFASDPNGSATSFGTSQCLDNSTFVPTPGFSDTNGTSILLPGTYSVAASERFAAGDGVFIELTDPDQDLDPYAPDTVEVAVSVDGSSESERLRLSETGDSTGIFRGVIQTTQASLGQAQSNNCLLETPAASQIRVAYVDAQDSADTAEQLALIDPGFRIFSSASGAVLDGAQVTLIDDATGLPAQDAAFADDGVTPFPVELVSGGVAVDDNGVNYNFASGTFYFPVLAPGNYRLEIQPPASYVFPSSETNAALDALPGGPYVLVQGSRGEAFTVVANSAPQFDLPLDPIDATVFVSKEANKEVAAIGDFVQYRVLIQNQDIAGQVSQLVLHDHLPRGFRLQTESVRVNNAPLNNLSELTLSDAGRRLEIPLGDLPTGDQIEVKYVLEVAAGTRNGIARNSATVSGIGVANANVAYADVVIEEDLFRSKSIIVGTVYAEACPSESEQKIQRAEKKQQALAGMPNVRVWMEDGSFVVTDQQGKYHFAGVEPGTHVLQLDESTIPSSHEVVACEENTRFAGAKASQFVDVEGGVLWRADFYVREKGAQSEVVVTRLDAQALPESGEVEYSYHIIGPAIDMTSANATISLDENLDYVKGSASLNGLPKGDPKSYGGGMYNFRLPGAAEAFSYELKFRAKVRHDQALSTAALTQLSTSAGRVKTDKLTNMLSFKWPASLFQVGESNPTLPKIEQANSAANAQALEDARSVNRNRYDRIAGADGVQAKVSRSALDESQQADPAPRSEVRASAQVYEPSRGSARSRSQAARTPVKVLPDTVETAPYSLPELDRGKPPPFDLAWLKRHHNEVGFAWPPERYNPVMPAIAVAVVHAQHLRPALLVDGQLVSPLSFVGVTKYHQKNMSVTRWDNVAISERDSVLSVQLQDEDGVTQQTYTRNVHYSGRPVRAELVREESYLVADGVYPPVMAVRLFDRAGYPLRAGTTGDFQVLPPYQGLDKTKHLVAGQFEFVNNKYKVLRDGIAYIQLEPTITSGEAQIDFQFDDVRQDSVRARLIPGQRDWMMVGLVEGSYQTSTIRDVEDPASVGLSDDPLSDGRVAFYAKGMVRGDWLLSVAYDTDKAFTRTLTEQIDPNQFYTLYGDGASQLYAAQSQQKLYLKVEKQRFSGLFGDFDTQLKRAQLSRYERRLNGAQLEYFGDRVEAKLFGAHTDQAFVRDELRGDGTSGVYRLSRSMLVRNSESVKVVTRDRFALDSIVSETTLQRFLDYSIDFDRGQLIFKQPILSQDEFLNPIFIEVEYEVAAGEEEELVVGARIAYKLDDEDSEVGVTHVTDQAVGTGGDLTGVDLAWQINEQYKLRAELAQSDTDAAGSAQAHLLEVEHASADFAGRFYYQELEAGFGLGHQSSLEAGTQKVGVEGEYRMLQHLVLRGHAFQQKLLASDDTRQITDLTAQWQLGPSQVRGGLRGVWEDSADGTARDAAQVLIGGSRPLFGGRLLLRGDAELDVSSADNVDYPSRSVVGVEYELVRNFRLVAEQEFTWGSDRDTQDTRIGFKSRPWTGADIGTTFTRSQGEEGSRLFATTGLLQQWQLDEHWLFDFGLDRVQTMAQSGSLLEESNSIFNPNLPAASGSFGQDFSAAFAGVGYRADHWSATSRLEFHQGDLADKWNLLVGVNRQLSEGKVMSLSGAMLMEERDGGAINDTIDVRLGSAWRPLGSRWSFLHRADLEFSTQDDGEFDSRSRKLVNNFNANYKYGDHQLSLQLGAKYVVDEIDGVEYDGVTALYGLQYRYSLGRKWDLGVAGSVLHSFDAALEHSAGVSVGYNAFANTWVSVGYNWSGFQDDDFVAAEYTASGAFFKIRLKLDQELAKRFLSFTGLAPQSEGVANGG